MDGASREEGGAPVCGCAGPSTRDSLVAEGFLHAGEAMLITGPSQRILDVNPAFTALTGWGRDAVLGESPARFIEPFVEGPASPLPAADALPARREVTYRNARGQACAGLMSLTPVRGQGHRPCHHVMVLVDLALFGADGRPAARHRHFDALTGMPNQQLLPRLLQDSLRQAWQRGGRLTVCSLDIDHFKDVNDRLGRETGDLALATFAQRLRHRLEGDDILARVGGDEFVLLLHHGGDARLDELLEAIREPLPLGERSLPLTASLGVTRYPDDDAADDILLRHATQAMYRAKRQGRNAFHVFDPSLDRELQVRQEHRRRFARAIDDQELRLHYQPQVDMSSGRVIGLEALVRWAHPVEGLLSPGQFLSSIEGTRLETTLGEWVIDQALAQLSAWQARGLHLPVHVNISPSHLLDEDFAARLDALLARHPEVPPGQLKLEVLETAAMHDIDAAQEVMERCRALGIEFALDDFGTGFSSLTNLRRLPVDLIKIDKSFVGAMLDDADDRAIVESVVYLVRRFGRPLLAEGVETLAHARALMALGCPLAQGYGIARPMPAEALPAWLVEWGGRADWHAIAMS